MQTCFPPCMRETPERKSLHYAFNFVLPAFRKQIKKMTWKQQDSQNPDEAVV